MFAELVDFLGFFFQGMKFQLPLLGIQGYEYILTNTVLLYNKSKFMSMQYLTLVSKNQ